MHNTAWTPEDDAVIREAAKTGVSVSRLAVRLRRSEQSIKARARKLGVNLAKLAQMPLREPKA